VKVFTKRYTDREINAKVAIKNKTLSITSGAFQYFILLVQKWRAKIIVKYHCKKENARKVFRYDIGVIKEE